MLEFESLTENEINVPLALSAFRDTILKVLVNEPLNNRRGGWGGWSKPEYPEETQDNHSNMRQSVLYIRGENSPPQPKHEKTQHALAEGSM